MTPEHIHIAINHVVFLGAAFALVPLLFGLLANNRACVLAGLLIAVIAGWTTPLVMASGEAAYERYEEGPVRAYLDAQVEHFLEEHEHRAETWSKVMYATAVVGTVCLALVFWKPSWLRPLAASAFVFCVASFVSGVWIAESGGKIRRPDFRIAQPLEKTPVWKSHTDKEEHETDD